MRALVLRVIFGTAILAAPGTFAHITFAQTHKVAKPEQVVRAVGVYEWTGDFAKPTASRLIPVSLYIEGKFQDAGIYIARPVPFALLSGNVYLLQTSGIDKGSLDLAYAKHLQAVEPTGDMAYDDGWFGYGSVKPLAAPRKTSAALKPSKTLPVITATPDPNRPHLVAKPSGDATATTASDPNKPSSTQTQTTTPATSKPDTTTASGTASPATSDDSDRPTMKRRSPDTSSPGTSSTASSDSNSSTTSTPADDPDRPTMKRRSPDATSSGNDPTTTTASTTRNAPADDPDRPTMKRSSPPSGNGSTTTDTASTTQPGNTPNDDPDRPTLKRHSAEDARRAGISANDIGVGSLNDDPNRPSLHHGKPTSSMTEEDLPKLTGIPPNLHQMVAVSDAVNRDTHPFTLDWDDEAQHQAVLQKMQTMARAQLAIYATTPTTAGPAPAAKKTAPTPTRARRTTTPAPPPVPLLEEQLNAYTLSYGGDPTYVYSANTGGTGAALRYVTIVAQADSLGEIKPAIQNVTDAAHLYRTPKMQFVDVVDAEASNRASLLFELRSQNARQFALYRVIAAHPEQIFITGTTQ
jgi:hypothetical protein